MCLNVPQLSKELVNQVYLFVKDKYERINKLNRFNHIIGVYNMATNLAKLYGVDLYKAQICALLHDYYKYESDEELKTLLTKEEIEECAGCTVMYHAFASSKVLAHFGINDIEMINAIKYHVFGHTNMTKLEEIILISDYTEDSRTYKDCIECREILLNGDLNKAIYESTKRTIKHLENENKTPHFEQLNVLDEYERKVNND